MNLKNLKILDFPFKVKQKVAWGDMDSFQHVNNTVYFRYFETARIAYFDKIQHPQGQNMLVGPILSETSCKFIKPIVYPDSLVVGVSITALANDNFNMTYGIFKDPEGECMAIGSGRVVSYDYKNKKRVQLPKIWREKINEIEGNS